MKFDHKEDAFLAGLDLIKIVRDYMVDERDSIELEDWISDLNEAIEYLVLSDSLKDD